MKRIAAICVAAAMFAAIGAPTGAVQLPATKRYASCKVMNVVYKGGVARASGLRNTKTVKGKKVLAESQYRPKVSASLYKANKSLDRDGDGIACER